MSEQEFRNWLEAAQLDDEAARALFKAAAWPACVFHCHQAVEKHMKALLYYQGKDTFSHSLSDMAETISRETGEKTPVGVEAAFRELDFHYTASRYPGVTSLNKLYDQEKAGQALQWMETARNYLKTIRLT